MGKVFRLHDGADGTGWFKSKLFNDDDLKSIATDGKQVSNSIPSPFARIDLVKEAFRWVALHGIGGNTAQHKLVSEALDIGQLLFYSDKYSDHIQIEEYNPADRLKKKFGDLMDRHKELATTLDVYWRQDEKVYNFEEADKIYFILYNNQLLGATSPASLFFSAPIREKLRKEIKLQRASGYYFSGRPVSLAGREWDFIEYLFLLSRQPLFPDKFPELYEYLEQVKEELDLADNNAIDNLDGSAIQEYEQCHVTGEPTNFCKVVDVPLCKAKPRTGEIESESDFVINNDHPIEGRKPLILPNKPFSQKWIYTTKDITWDPNAYNGKIPDKNNSPLEQATLPIQGDQYPWLSAGNFLQDHIIKLPYEIDSEKFVTVKGSGGNSYLLPLTETFFRYFDVESASKMIELEELSQGTVVAKLDIRTKGGIIKYEKHYREKDKKELKLHLAILPFVKVETEDIPIKYTIGVIDADLKNNDRNNIALQFFRNGNEVTASEPTVRAPGKMKDKSFYISTDEYFNTIRVTFDGEVQGYILPKMKEYAPSVETCDFAIDFGTTNTHIEYKVGNKAEKAFEVDSTNTLWSSLLDRNRNTDPIHEARESLFDMELMPHSMGEDDSEAEFPLRTAIVENKENGKAALQKQLFKHANNYLLYETTEKRNHLGLSTNLKWGSLNSEDNVVRVKLYIEYLLRLIKYKCLFLNINLSKINLVWFFPTSMTTYHQGRLNGVWKEKIKEVFGSSFNSDQSNSIPESVGPYFYHLKKYATPGVTLSVDIGGGSTDVSLYDEGEVKLISSFRFAGDALFGDGYGRQPGRNGFVASYKDKVLNLLDEGSDEEHIIKDILEEREVSQDFSSYLFSQSATNSPVNYSAWIKDDTYIKLSILIFHGAIAYYISNMLANMDMPVPQNIIFSGSASQTVGLIDSSSDNSYISHFYSYFLQNNAKGEDKTIKSHLSSLPKELTAKGGLLKRDVNDDYKRLFWLGGSGECNRNIDLSNLSVAPSCEEVEDSMLAFVSDSIQDFYARFDRYTQSSNVEQSFGISRQAVRKFKELRGQNINSYIRKGLKNAFDNHHESLEEPIEESLFFYPMVGEIHRITYELSKVRGAK